MKTDARLILRLLGPFSAEAEGMPSLTVRISSRKARALIAYLAMHPEHRASREQLADLLWGNRFDAQARQSLRQGLVSLRRELETWAPRLLVAQNETVGLDARFFTADALEFAVLGESADPAVLERAAALYGGQFLVGLDLEVEAFDQWLREQRSRLAALASRVFAGIAEHADATGCGPKSVAMAERLVELDPLREDFQRLLLRLLARHRGRDDALTHAQTMTKLLRSELDVEPAPDTLAVIEAIKRGAIASAPLSVAAATAAPLVTTAVSADDLAPDSTPSTRRLTWRWRDFGASKAGVVIASLTLVVGLAVSAGVWLVTDRLMPLPDAGSPAIDIVSADQSWRSPPIYPGAAVDAQALGAKGIQAIVVLPFTTEAGDGSPEQTLADRITEDLINDLSRVPAIRVIARQTARTYRGRAVDVAAIRAELGVHYLVEGSVRMQGPTVRINVALVNAENRLQVWSDRFERSEAERFAVQDEIARGLARRLQLGVVTFEADRRDRKGAGDPTIAEYLAKGWAIAFRSLRTGVLDGAAAHFEAVLGLDPDSLSALVGLATVHIGHVQLMLVPEREPSLVRAEELLARALRLYPQSSVPHYTLGVLRRMRGELEPALSSLARALELNPSYAPAYAQVGSVLTRLGRPEEALEHIRYAIRLSPNDPHLPRGSRSGELPSSTAGMTKSPSTGSTAPPR